MPLNKKLNWGGISSLADFLIQQNLVNEEAFTEVNQFISETGSNVGTAIMFLKCVPSQDLGRMLEEKLGIPWAQQDSIQLSIRKLLPENTAKEYQVIPLNVLFESGTRVLILGMTDPFDDLAISEVERVCHCKVQPSFITLDQLQEFFKKYYKSGLLLSAPEVTAHNVQLARKRVKAVTTPTKQPITVHDQVFALVSLLEKKGILTLKEWEKELKSIMSNHP